MYRKVYITKKYIPPEVLNTLREANFEIVMAESFPIFNERNFEKRIRGSFAIMCTEADKIDKFILDAAGPELKVVSTINMSFEHIDVDECRKRNIIVANVPFYSEVVAEYAIGLLLTVGRRMAEASNLITSVNWTEWKHKPFGGKVLKGSVVGFTGMQILGVEIIKRITAFAVKSCHYHFTDCTTIQPGSLEATPLPFDELIATSDFVISGYNFEKYNEEIFHRRIFDMMKNNAVFIHIGSAEPDHLNVLYYALITGKIGAAGLDITIDKPLFLIKELLSLPNVGVWGWMTAAGPGELVRIDGSLKATKYIDILENFLLPALEMLFRESVVNYVHERPPIHAARVTANWLSRQQIMKVIPSPARGADIMPIGNLWADLIADISIAKTPNELWGKIKLKLSSDIY